MEVSQIQFIARLPGHSSCATDLLMAVMVAMFRWAWDGVFGGIDAFFRAPPVVPELSASFRALERSHL